MYYVVTKTWSDKPGLTVLAACRTVRGLARRLRPMQREYRRIYGYNTIFPTSPWAVKSDTRPESYDWASFRAAAGDLEAAGL